MSSWSCFRHNDIAASIDDSQLWCQRRLFGELHLEVPQRRHLTECRTKGKSLIHTLRKLEEHSADMDDVVDPEFPFISTDALNSDIGSALMQLGMSYLWAWDPSR